MAKAMKIKQLSFSLPNRIGLLSELSSFLTAAKINIEAICAYGMGDEGYFMIVTDNNSQSKEGDLSDGSRGEGGRGDCGRDAKQGGSIEASGKARSRMPGSTSTMSTEAR